jgi:predicted metal-dependent enzyme (double-stranded beta helix superfamily)
MITAGIQVPAVSAGAGAAISPSRLAQIVRRTAERPELWRPRVQFEADERWYGRLECGDEYEVWLLTWLPGQQTGFHDHGDSCGAFTVASGSLTEQAAVCGRPETRSRRLRTGAVRSFGTRYVHDVRNDAIEPAVSIHAYSPPLSSMHRFEVASDGLLRVAVEERSW